MKTSKCLLFKRKVSFLGNTKRAREQEILEQLITTVTSTPVLPYPDFKLSLVLQIDTSGTGLGCGLYQTQNNVQRVIGFKNSTLTDSEKKYHNSKLEFPALKWDLYDHFKEYVFCTKNCNIYKENSTLLYAMTLKKLCVIEQR